MNTKKRREHPFFDLYEDEYIVSVIRRHWLAFIGNIVIIFFLLVIFIAGVIFLGRAITDSRAQGASNIQCDIENAISNNIGAGFLITFGSMYILSVVGFFFISWLDFYLDIFVLTNKRIIRFEQIILFGKKVSETSFQHVQDVSSKVHGVVNTMFNVGTVFIETAGENENFSFDNIKDPGLISAQILELQRAMWDEEGKKSDFGYMGEKKDGSMEDDGIPSEIDCVKVGEQEFCKVPSADSGTGNHSAGDPPKTENAPASSVGIAPGIPLVTPSSIAPPASEPLKDPTQKYNDGRIVTPYGVIWQSEQDPTPDVLDALNSMDANNGMAELGEW